ncbi:MAG: transglutaminase TgpA family protein [Streptosporangiaceae bacterium]
MNLRLTGAAAAAVIAASFVNFTLIRGAVWFAAVAGAALIVALAGTLTRSGPVPSAVGASLLALAATAPLLTSGSLYLAVAAIAIIACCAASATGFGPLRLIATAVSYLAALLLYLTVTLTARLAVALVVPTAGSLRHLRDLISGGLAQARFSPPVYATPGVILLAAGGIGLAAVVVDVLAVRLRRPAVAGLPLMLVFLAPVATAADVGGLTATVGFLLAAAGYLALLSADGRHRLRAWGRVVTVWHSTGEDDRLAGAEVGALAATGRRIGLAAVCVAVIAPLLLPSLNLHRLFSSATSGPGQTSVGLPNPVDQLHGLLTRRHPQQVLSYRSSSASAQDYLQVYVLNYDSSTGNWDLIQPKASVRVGHGVLQPAPGMTAGTALTTIRSTITFGRVSGYAWPVFFLPLPYWPEQVQVPGSWREADGTLMIYSTAISHSGLSYTVVSGHPDPSRATLALPQHPPASITGSYLGYDSPVTNQLRALADRITRGRRTAIGRAIALQNWLRSSRFSYSLRSDIPDSPHGLLTFLTTDRQGYCQQFAFAMAVLARLVGIPSRIAIGYTAGTRQPNGSWLVTTADAHAWPELYFQDVGWIRFEPTPGGVGGQGTAAVPGYTRAVAPGGTRTHPVGGPTSQPSASPTPSSKPSNVLSHVRHPGSGGGQTLPASQGGGPPAGLLVLAVLVLAAIAPGSARLLTRRRRWRAARSDAARADTAWRELCDDLDDFGLRRRPSDSPRALAARLRSLVDFDGAADASLTRVTTVVERVRYAPSPASAEGIRADVTRIRRALARSAGRADRLRARFAPASTLAPLRSGTAQALGLLTGWAPRSSRTGTAD